MGLHQIPEDRREAARGALMAAFGRAPDGPMQPMLGGASGALAYRFQAESHDYVLRVANPRADALRNPHQYACMQAASEAGVAPPLRYVDGSTGVAIMDFVEQRPLSAFPGGPAALAAAVGDLLKRLQGGPVFPSLYAYPEVMDRLLGFVRTAGHFAPGALDRHAEGFEQIRTAYPWTADRQVASHNDPNPRNILFDGQRLWLIDWETAYANDPMVDVAIVTHELAATDPLEDVLLKAWLGREPDGDMRARLALMKPLTRLYYGVLLMSVAPPPEVPDQDLSALSVEAFGADVAAGRLALGSPEMLRALGKMMLAGFLADLESRAYADALARFAR